MPDIAATLKNAILGKKTGATVTPPPTTPTVKGATNPVKPKVVVSDTPTAPTTPTPQAPPVMNNKTQPNIYQRPDLDGIKPQTGTVKPQIPMNNKTQPNIYQKPDLDGLGNAAKPPVVQQPPQVTPQAPPVNQPQVPQINPTLAENIQKAQAQRQGAIDQLNNSYGDVIEAARNQFNLDKQKAADNYTGFRNEASVNSARNLQALKEQMASQGLFNSGDNITGQMNINNQRASDLAGYNKAEQDSYNSLSANLQNVLANVGSNRAKDLLNQTNLDIDRSTDNMKWQTEQDYRNNRDKINDQRYSSEWDYRVNRDNISDGRYDKEWNYKTDRDKVNDNRYFDERDYNRNWQQKQWDYNTNRDNISDQRYTDERDYNRNWQQKQWDYNTNRDTINDNRYFEERDYNRNWQKDERDYSRDRDKINDNRYTDERDYNRGRDKINDDRYTDERDYNRGRDKISDDRYTDERDYNRGRDSLSDQRYNTEWDYRKERDSVSDSQWEKSYNLSASRGSGGGGGGSYGSGSQGNSSAGMAWESFGSMLDQGGTPEAYKWLSGNEEALKSAIGATEYNRMKDTLAEVINQNNTQYRRNKNSSPQYGWGD